MKDYCIDSHFRGANERIGLELCTKDNPGARGEQNFALTWRKVRSGGNVLHLNQGHFNFYIEATDTCVLKIAFELDFKRYFAVFRIWIRIKICFLDPDPGGKKA